MPIPVSVELMPKRRKSKREKELYILSHITLTDFRTFLPHLSRSGQMGYTHLGNNYFNHKAPSKSNNLKDLSSDGQIGFYFLQVSQ